MSVGQNTIQNEKQRRFIAAVFIKTFHLVSLSDRSLADCCPLLEVEDMIMMGNNPDPMCVFTYVQSLCHSLTKIEKERKDKENKEKNKDGDEGEEGADGEGEVPVEEDKGEPAETETTESQEEKQEDVSETEETGKEQSTLNSSEMEQDGGLLVETES